MPGFGKSGTSRINAFKWSIQLRSLKHQALLPFNAKCRVRPCRLQIYLFHVIHYRPLRACRQVMLESLNTARRSLCPRLNTAIRTVAHVTYNLMPRRCALGKETIADSLHVAFNQKLSRYSQTNTLALTYT